jgi:hypothetical protein
VEKVTNGAKSGTAAFDAWEVPVPAWIDASKQIFSNPQAIPRYFNGLELFHNPIKNTVRPILPLAKRQVPAQFTRPTRLICDFIYANAELWKWAGEMKREKKIIALEEWIDPDCQLKRAEAEGSNFVASHYQDWAEHAGFGLERDYSVA